MNDFARFVWLQNLKLLPGVGEVLRRAKIKEAEEALEYFHKQFVEPMMESILVKLSSRHANMIYCFIKRYILSYSG